MVAVFRKLAVQMITETHVRDLWILGPVQLSMAWSFQPILAEVDFHQNTYVVVIMQGDTYFY